MHLFLNASSALFPFLCLPTYRLVRMPAKLESYSRNQLPPGLPVVRKNASTALLKAC